MVLKLILPLAHLIFVTSRIIFYLKFFSVKNYILLSLLFYFADFYCFIYDVFSVTVSFSSMLASIVLYKG